MHKIAPSRARESSLPDSTKDSTKDFCPESSQDSGLDSALDSGLIALESMSPAEYCQHFCAKDSMLIARLDLAEFLYRFAGFLARPAGVYLQGDMHQHYALIQEIDSLPTLPKLPHIPDLSHAFMLLQKQGVLSLEQLCFLAREMEFFASLQRALEPYPELHFTQMIAKIHIPELLRQQLCIFDEKGALRIGAHEIIDRLQEQLAQVKASIKSTLTQLLHKDSLAPYLVDRQIHLLFDTQTLLLKAGYTRALKGSVLDRTQGGFFYVLPQEIARLYERERELHDLLALEIAKLCASLSEIARKELAFLRFLDGRFALCDGLLARVGFARAYDLEIVPARTQARTGANSPVKPSAKSATKSAAKSKPPFILQGFCHPILRDPVPVSVDFTSSLLLLTGVNAGGKTMLLKSLLSAAFLAKHLIPMKITAHKSSIPHYKHIYAIISNPQNSRNDISTFAGRVMEFSEQFARDDLLLGVDEIELGTDADEAASLYKTLLEILLDRGDKLVVTTHHKRLAALMAQDPRVQLSAALFDLERYRATFTFLHGSIGKSYAFESAERYGIPSHIIKRARIHYGEDKERLNALIEKSINLELELESKRAELEREAQRAKKLQEHYTQKIIELESAYATKQRELESTYHHAQAALKKQAKTLQDIHRNLNEAHAILEPVRKFGRGESSREESSRAESNKNRQNTKPQSNQNPPESQQPKSHKIGDVISYKAQRARIVQLDARLALLELDSGMRVRVKRAEIARASKIPNNLAGKFAESSALDSGAKGMGAKDPASKATPKRAILSTKLLAQPKGASPSLDLHGMRAEEAAERVQDFISDSLLAGFDEVLIYHGIGSGVLSRVVAEILRMHPSVVGFSDAPAHMGGMGAKLVRL